jgi:hypothetical protein
MKKLIILLVVEYVVAYFLVMACCPIRGAEERAWAAWHDHPTAETRAEFDRQRHITELTALIPSSVLFCGMAGVTLLIARAWRQRHATPKDLKHDHVA